MIAVGLTVPIACWRKGAARELLETEDLPPPATCYGALLSFVGEVDRERHRGARVTAGLVNRPGRSTVLRTLWRVKNKKTLPGNGENARPDYQQLVIDAHLVVYCDSGDEVGPGDSLEARVRRAFADPSTVDRFGGWSLGESTHLINDAWLYGDGAAPEGVEVFLLASPGRLTLPVWVDHVGSSGTLHAVGLLEPLAARARPDRDRLPQIPLEVSATAARR